MFSGIIEKRGTVHSVEEEDGTVIIELATGYEGLELGESIAVNGVCLTVVKFNAKARRPFSSAARPLPAAILAVLHR